MRLLRRAGEVARPGHGQEVRELLEGHSRRLSKPDFRCIGRLVETAPSVADVQTLRLYRSTVGKKAVMAVTGVALLLFVVGHMVGNLAIFSGPAAIDGYAAWLRE